MKYLGNEVRDSAGGTRQRLGDEGPTICLLIVCYMSYACITVYAAQLTTGLATVLLVPVLVLHSSLQHEMLHGHPFRRQKLNDLLVFPPLGLLIPYVRFKDTHLAHHYDPSLTDPYDDPESNYLDPRKWNSFCRARRALYDLNNTLAGRMLIGPAIGLGCFYRRDFHSVRSGDRKVLGAYISHMAGLLLVAAWLTSFSTLPAWAYLLAAYLAVSMLKIRTYLEHRAHERAASRSVIIEDSGPLALLFLNNNYHAVHHAFPGKAWHKLPALFRRRREDFIRRNGGYCYTSYLEVFRRYLFSRKDPVAHPLMTGNEDAVETAGPHPEETKTGTPPRGATAADAG